MNKFIWEASDLHTINTDIVNGHTRFMWEISDLRVIDNNVVSKGGKGSGNFGHSGRPGKVGGSGPSTRQSIDIQTRLANGTITFAKDSIFGVGLGGVTAGKRLGVMDDGTQVLAKPDSGGGYFRPHPVQSEVMTYEIATALGWEDLVTPSAIRTSPDGDIFSVQVMQDGVTYQTFVNPLEWNDESRDYVHMPPAMKHDMNRIVLLDAITGNDDRHNNNVLVVERNGQHRFMAIDNDATFNVKEYHGGISAERLIRKTKMSAMKYNRPQFTRSEIAPIVALSYNSKFHARITDTFGDVEGQAFIARLNEIASWYDTLPPNS